jgi:hypothetical protein
MFLVVEMEQYVKILVSGKIGVCLAHLGYTQLKFPLPRKLHG